MATAEQVESVEQAGATLSRQSTVELLVLLSTTPIQTLCETAQHESDDCETLTTSFLFKEDLGVLAGRALS